MEKSLSDGVGQIDDNTAVALAKSGDDSAVDLVIKKYSPLAHARAVYFAPTGEVEDYSQEGLFALVSAIDSFDPAVCEFAAFARLCIDRRLISVLRRRSAKKFLPDDRRAELSELICPSFDTPEENLISKESYEALLENIKNDLSEFEYKVLSAYLDCGEVSKVFKLLECDSKQISNALCRIRSKLKKYNMPR